MMTGVGRRFKAHRASIRIVLADPVGSGLADWVESGVPGPDGSYAVEGIGASEPPANLDRSVLDAAERVSDEESFAMVKLRLGFWPAGRGFGGIAIIRLGFITKHADS